MTIHLLLASQSPRRRELIKLIGLPFSVTRANVDENSIAEPDPATNAIKTAKLKAQAIASQIQGQIATTIIIAADTIVSLEHQMLGKPRNEVDAKYMLQVLRDRKHEVHTGMVLVDMRNGEMIEGVHTAVVTMRPYTDKEIDTYIATGDPLDKAGAYAIQHPQFKPASQLSGCYLGVMGLSICHLSQMLAQLNIPAKTNLTALHKAHQTSSCSILKLLV